MDESGTFLVGTHRTIERAQRLADRRRFLLEVWDNVVSPVLLLALFGTVLYLWVLVCFHAPLK